MPRDSHPHHHFQTHTQSRQLGLTTLHLLLSAAAGSVTAAAKTPQAAEIVVEGCAEEADLDGLGVVGSDVEGCAAEEDDLERAVGRG